MIRFCVYTLICLLCCATTELQSQDTTYAPVAFPGDYQSSLNEVYVEVNGWQGKLDVYFPTQSGASVPLLINIHGGGWNKGVKESQTGFSTFFKAGFAVANIEYRLSQQATAPAGVQDVRCAILYLVKNAKRFHFDVNRIVLMGGSAGGHLALMGGLVDASAGFDSDCAQGVGTFKIAAILDKYGIVNVWDWAYGKVLTSKSATQWLGAKAKDESFAKSVSPIYQLKASSPPIFIVHGDADPTVPVEHSRQLAERCKELGVPHELMIIPGGLHGKFSKEQNSELNRAMIQFLKNQKII